jgi:hypothetical protein
MINYNSNSLEINKLICETLSAKHTNVVFSYTFNYISANGIIILYIRDKEIFGYSYMTPLTNIYDCDMFIKIEEHVNKYVTVL